MAGFGEELARIYKGQQEVEQSKRRSAATQQERQRDLGRAGLKVAQTQMRVNGRTGLQELNIVHGFQVDARYSWAGKLTRPAEFRTLESIKYPGWLMSLYNNNSYDDNIHRSTFGMFLATSGGVCYVKTDRDANRFDPEIKVRVADVHNVGSAVQWVTGEQAERRVASEDNFISEKALDEVQERLINFSLTNNLTDRLGGLLG
jgi:hypothetical protein